ncbi:hypothetical protein GWI33_017815 [Rhynchophorus ferrugineus]|uniref:Uncharacterized protein n=1 Tax=Rhynchophorus ferrugineus TaxID=354439 RepID=A0A834I1A8_RHYFE|nr:hypothetical protein GWI33_017815 [Rhynchophorus ferrugineus]
MQFGKAEVPISARKRAMSECYKTTVSKVSSDTELNKIDKEKTFKPTTAFFLQTGLLLKVVNALSNEAINSQESEAGVHGFSDKNILASEMYEPGVTQVKPQFGNRQCN